MSERARCSTLPQWSLDVRAAGQSGASTAGKLAAHTWLRTRGLSAPALRPWHIEISFDVRDAPAAAQFEERTDTRFRLEIYSEEWGFFFCHRGRASWIRVTDIPFVHGRDDFNMLRSTPALEDIGALFRAVQQQHSITFRREHALVRTNVPSAEPAIRVWIQTL